MKNVDNPPPALITDRRHVPAVGGATLTAVLAVSALALMVEGLNPLFKVAGAAAIVTQQVYDYWDAGRQVRARRPGADPAAAARLQRYGTGDFQGVTTAAVLAVVAVVGVATKLAADGRLVVDLMSWGVPGAVLVGLAAVDVGVALVRDSVNSARAALRQEPVPADRTGPSRTPAAPPPASARMVKAPRYGLILEPGEQSRRSEHLQDDQAGRRG
ncbi:hypothetical protein ATJ97_0589 [Georgenia soli]|uniref:Uncharacterized protein n=1 Tax=Georgenia soli TaxID=638953 RepID=A0A2A9EIP3_9MICO|nr:hypothetical protein [Georgenia soli]PFG38119.1 hypothetical protein ATJ97_0589 [Georgenia soli]